MVRIVRDCQELSETETDCIALAFVLALSQIHVNNFYSHPVVAFSNKYANLGSTRIGFHNHFVNAKNALLRVRINSGMHV